MAVPAQKAMMLWLDSARKTATREFQQDLESLFLDAKNQFPDIVWDTEAETDEDWELPGQIWGHKAIIIARGRPMFCARYLIQSTEPKSNRNIEEWVEWVTPFSRPTISPSKTSCNHALLSLDLRQLYTAEDILHGSYDENKFQTTSSDERHLDSLRMDLLSMWKTQLCSDIRITISELSGVKDGLGQDFLSHRFLLSSRSPYFRRVLRDSSQRKIASQAEPVSIALVDLPCTHFTLAALPFILVYLYTGALKFGKRFNLATAFSIFRGSLYLELPVLQELILAEITVEMLHGLYHAYLSDPYFSSLVGGKWSMLVKLGCECTTCATCLPLVLQFAQEDGIKNDILERGARRGLIGLFGKGWCTEQFSTLPESMIDSILTDMQGLITPSNIFLLLFNAESALLELGSAKKSWERVVKSTILCVRESIDKVLCINAETCFKLNMWSNLFVDDRAADISQRQKTYQRVTWVLEAVSRGANQRNASNLYEALVSSTNTYMRRRPYGLDDFFSGARIERTQVELLRMIEVSSVWSPIAAAHQLEPLESAHSVRPRTSTTTYYSFLSTPRTTLSLEEPVNSGHIAALDLAPTSLYSAASSRTISTDYGIYYPRRGFSQESESGQDWRSIRGSARRQSWDSFRY
ncbi:hypothetical protein GALMADRAFT_241816 [Galerina marginata CBS 339.88]|uniref:BTB domain-containing protein n=1 Tax=Galerina marginata (strain CBS 339.88) TaxID=685588 RepID=A0A067TQR4_GALM3|nr:hypothetical protein GALMADRAFT_241816 [Galerina marginata CBS 339.88]